MKKLTVWALLATLLVAGSAFAAPPAKVRANATYGTDAPATTNNDDSCDIGTAPAATLLLPYFEVDVDDPGGETTIFTITNTSEVETIAHVVLWTDYSYPVVDFNIYLTGYDVQSINLYDVIERGIIAPESGEKEFDGTDNDASPGATTDVEDPTLSDGACDDLPGEVPDEYIERMQSALIDGEVVALGTFGACGTVGNVHENAVGYATIDVVDFCGFGLPTDGDDYFATEIRFDNVLVGDYQQVNNGENNAQGNPMVHIRAIPEGSGDAGELLVTNFDRTFYSRYQDDLTQTTDRRQPLPATFAARWINGGAGDFGTFLKIWREGTTGAIPAPVGGVGSGPTACADWPDNGVITVTELVTFDEDENGEGIVGPGGVIISPPPPGADAITLPETGLHDVGDEPFPQLAGTTGGWIYLNLNSGSPGGGNAIDPDIASQNWVVSSMRADGRLSLDFDAAWLGNGCTGAIALSDFSEDADGNQGEGTVGPAPDTTPDFVP